MWALCASALFSACGDSDQGPSEGGASDAPPISDDARSDASVDTSVDTSDGPGSTDVRVLDSGVGSDAGFDGNIEAGGDARDATPDAADGSAATDRGPVVDHVDATDISNDISNDVRDADAADIDADAAGQNGEGGSADSSPPPPDSAECTYHGQCPSTRPFCGWWKCWAVTSVSVLPGVATIPSGATMQFSAEATLSNGTTASNLSSLTWSLTYGTGSGEIYSNGLAKGRTLGTVHIHVDFLGIAASTEATVTAGTLTSIETMEPPSVLPGTTLPLRAIGRYSDGATQEVTNQAVWTTNDPAVVILDTAAHTVTAGQVGDATLVATLGNIFDVSWLLVSNKTLTALRMDTNSGTYETGLAKGFEVVAEYSDGTFGYLNKDAAWSSSNPAVAFVTSSNDGPGWVQMIAPGTTNITATFGGLTASAALTVTGSAIQSIVLAPTTATAQETTTVQYSLTGTSADSSVKDLTYVATWSSSNPLAAILNDPSKPPNWALATSLAAGTTTVTAKFGSLSASGVLTVTR